MVTVLVDLSAGPVGRAVALVLAQDPVPDPKGDEFGEASPVGLVVVILLGIATFLLVRSMTKRLRRLPASFDEPGPSPVHPAPGDDDPGPATDVETSPDRRTPDR